MAFAYVTTNEARRKGFGACPVGEGLPQSGEDRSSRAVGDWLSREDKGRIPCGQSCGTEMGAKDRGTT